MTYCTHSTPTFNFQLFTSFPQKFPIKCFEVKKYFHGSEFNICAFIFKVKPLGPATIFYNNNHCNEISPIEVGMAVCTLRLLMKTEGPAEMRRSADNDRHFKSIAIGHHYMYADMLA